MLDVHEFLSDVVKVRYTARKLKVQPSNRCNEQNVVHFADPKNPKTGRFLDRSNMDIMDFVQY